MVRVGPSPLSSDLASLVLDVRCTIPIGCRGRIGSQKRPRFASKHGNAGWGTLNLGLSVPAASGIRELLTGRIVAEKIPSGESTLPIKLAGARARLLHVYPIR